MIKKERFSLQENYSTFSFNPFILILYKEDLVRLIETTGKDFPKVDIQLGQKKLEEKIQFIADVESLANRDNNAEKIFSHLYISLRTSASAMMAANMIVEITPNSNSLYIFDRSDERLVKLGKEIMQIIRSRDPYRYLRNRFVSLAVFIIDFAFLFYTVFLKDLIEKTLNFSMPDMMILAFVLLLNSMFLVPHGKNKIFLKNKDEIGVFTKFRECTVVCGILLLAFADLVLIVLKLIKVI
jgi:hypothetical protein